MKTMCIYHGNCVDGFAAADVERVVVHQVALALGVRT